MATLNGQDITLVGPDEGDPTTPGQLIVTQSSTPVDADDLYSAFDTPNYVFQAGGPPSTGVSPVLLAPARIRY